MDKKRDSNSINERLLHILGAGALTGGASRIAKYFVKAPNELKNKTSAIAGAGAALTQAGIEGGGYFGDDSKQSRVLGGTLGGAVGGLGQIALNPITGQIVDALSAKYIVPKNTVRKILLGSGVLVGGGLGALSGLIFGGKDD